VADTKPTLEQQPARAIRSFSVAMPEAALDDLRRRIAATRWPNRELVEDRSQGVQLAAVQALFRYWADEYDLGRVQARLNALPQFTTAWEAPELFAAELRAAFPTGARRPFLTTIAEGGKP
jgi:hypothetical protein